MATPAYRPGHPVLGRGYGSAEELTDHALSVLTTRPAWHVCCRRPLDVPLIFDRLASGRKPFTADFNLASARVLMPAVRAVLGRASAVFVNTAELGILSQAVHLGDLCLVVVSDGPRPAVVLRRGQLAARVMPPQVAVAEVTGAGDVLAGTFLDGTGKTTIAETLRVRYGFRVIHSGRTPDGTNLAERYRRILALPA